MNNLFEIFPVNSDAILKGRKERIKMIKLMKQVLALSEKALSYFLAGKIDFFDPQVGETSCQIRGYKISSLANQLNSTEFSSFLEEAYLSLKKNMRKSA